METRQIWALTAATLLAIGSVCAQETTHGDNQPPSRPRVGGAEKQEHLTEEQRQVTRDRSEGMSDEERAGAQARGRDSRRPGDFTEEERQAMRERRGSMSDEERAAARERAAQQRGGQVGGQFPSGGRAGGQPGGQFPGGMSRGGMGQ